MSLIADPLSAGLSLATGIINKIWPDKTEQEKQQLANDFALVYGQIEVNKVEAASPSIFVAGWRPYIGWICGTGLGYQFIIYPILVAFIPKIVQLDMGTLITLLLGMLGLSGMRTQEKLKGVS